MVGGGGLDKGNGYWRYGNPSKLSQRQGCTGSSSGFFQDQHCQRAGQGRAQNWADIRSGKDVYNADSSDVWRIVKLGGPIQMAQVGAWVWPFVCHTLMSYCLELPSDGGNSLRHLTMEDCWWVTFADIGTVSPSVLQGPSGCHSRASQLCKHQFL